MHTAIHQKSGKVIVDKVRVAEDLKSRSKGLLGQKHMRDGEALLIKPCRSIHTFFMRFSIDVLFLDKQGKVVKIVHSMPPFRLAGCFLRGCMVLELKDGVLGGLDIKIGDVLEIKPSPQR